MSDYTAQNMKAFSEGVKIHIESQITPKLTAMLERVAATMVQIADASFEPFYGYDPHAPFGGNNQFPVWHGQLHDANGVAVYINGKTVSFMPTKRAKVPQSYGSIKNIVGHDWLKIAIDEGAARFSKGIWIVLFSAVPYAYDVNTWSSPIGRGMGYFERFKADLLNDVLNGLKPIAQINSVNAI